MKYTIVGLFKSQDLAKEIATDLEQSGIRNEDYIVYTTNKKEAVVEKRNFWKKILGLQVAENTSKIESLITSVAAQNEDEKMNIKKSFEKNNAVKIYEFQDMTLEEAKNLDYVKKVVALRAKSQIYAMPKISVSRNGLHEGITTEVKA